MDLEREMNKSNKLFNNLSPGEINLEDIEESTTSKRVTDKFKEINRWSEDRELFVKEELQETQEAKVEYLLIEGVALILDSVREAKEENISGENLLLCVNKLEKLLRNSINDSWNYCYLLHGKVIKVLKKHGISVNEIINNIANGDEYDILRNAIIQDKIEDMNKNPKN
nr:3136_t:CDS:2 [Entrophospora candida]